MKALVLSLSAAVALSCGAMANVTDDLSPIEPEVAKKFGKIFAEHAAKFDKPQIQIEADPEKSNGVHVPDKVGVLIVPQKDLKESEELAAKFKAEKGAPLAFLFMYRVTPVVNGQPVDPSKVRTIKVDGENGAVHTVYCVLLSVRQNAEDDYRLYAYGHEEKPLVDAKFSEGTGPGAEPTAVEIKEVNEQTRQGQLVVTVFGKYQASFTVGHKAE
jgi:hypothetical protein